MNCSVAIALVLAGSVTSMAILGDRANAPPASSRLLAVISDLHFGVGRQDSRWHAMEDFRWGPEFKAFLSEIHSQGKGSTDLVLAGDTFELWQSLSADCSDANPDFGCTEAEALARISRVIAAHSDELRALGDFARAGDNRVVFIPGNHDAALLFPAVAEAVVKATQVGTDRVRVDMRGYWLSPDGLILVEHGHQMGHEVNKLKSWPRPFVGANPQHLERSWGEQFVQSFYNQYEAKYPIIDNVSEESVGIRYAREVEGWSGIRQAFGRFARFYLFNLSSAQHVSALGTDATPTWDIAQIKKQGARFLVESFPADDPVGRVVRQPKSSPGIDPQALTEADINGICDARALINAYQLERGQKPSVFLCPTTNASLGAAGQALLQKSRSAILSEYLVARHRELTDASVITSPIRMFIYGHTHLSDAGFRPMSDTHPDWDPIVLNTGAWQRTVSPENLEKLGCRVTGNQSVIQLQPDDLPACYSAVLVSPYSDRPGAQLRFWTRDSSKAWGLTDACQWTSPCR